MIRAALVIALGAACGSSAPPQAIEARATPAVAPHVTAAPTVQWIDNGFDVTGLPAVTEDGSLVVLGVHHEDGGRGAPNLALAVIDRIDRPVETTNVLGVAEVDTMFDAHGVTPALRARIAKANDWLAAFHARNHLVAFTALSPDTTREERTRATGDGIVVEWKPRQFTITSGDRVLATHETSPTWIAEDHPMCPTCKEVCHNPAYLAGAHVDVQRRIAVLTISYMGTDTCWEPSTQQRVVAW